MSPRPQEPWHKPSHIGTEPNLFPTHGKAVRLNRHGTGTLTRFHGGRARSICPARAKRCPQAPPSPQRARCGPLAPQVPAWPARPPHPRQALSARPDTHVPLEHELCPHDAMPHAQSSLGCPMRVLLRHAAAVLHALQRCTPPQDGTSPQCDNRPPARMQDGTSHQATSGHLLERRMARRPSATSGHLLECRMARRTSATTGHLLECRMARRPSATTGHLLECRMARRTSAT